MKRGLALLLLLFLPCIAIIADEESVSGEVGVGQFYNLTISSSGISEIEGRALVKIDGNAVGEVYDGSSITVEVKEGTHSVWVEEQTTGVEYTYSFDHWEGGSSDDPITINVVSDMELVAYYIKTPITTPSPPPVPPPGTRPPTTTAPPPVTTAPPKVIIITPSRGASFFIILIILILLIVGLILVLYYKKEKGESAPSSQLKGFIFPLIK